MPYETNWVDPELLLTHDEIEVFYTYKNNDMDEGPRSFWYTTDELGQECGAAAFDVREVYRDLERIDGSDLQGLNDDIEDDHEAIIRLGIDNNLITSKKDS